MVIHSQKELKKVAKDILDLRPRIIALEGPLGAGKTTLTKEIAKVLGISENVISPTYVLETEYRIPARNAFSIADAGGPNTKQLFIHIDCYRLENVSELINLGIEKRIENGDLIIIEWADKFPEFFKNYPVTYIKMSLGKNDNERVISVTHPYPLS